VKRRQVWCCSVKRLHRRAPISSNLHSQHHITHPSNTILIRLPSNSYRSTFISQTRSSKLNQSSFKAKSTIIIIIIIIDLVIVKPKPKKLIKLPISKDMSKFVWLRQGIEETDLDWEGPRSGFSVRGWKDNLPRVCRRQSPWELVQQSLTSMVAMKTPIWIMTNTETTHVSPRRRPPLDFINGILWSGAGDSFTSMRCKLSAIAKNLQDSISR